MVIAHSANAQGQQHDLVDHLQSVAKLASEFAAKFGAGDLAYWAGLWHDIGKVHPSFQQYLHDCETHPGKQRRGPDHKRAGALVAAKKHELLSFLIAGHHGGLPGRADLKSWLKEKIQPAQEAIQRISSHLPEVEPPTVLPPPTHLRSELDAEFFVRMLFSTLVDADFLDTERHFNVEQADKRGNTATLAELWNRFANDQQRLTGKETDRVNRVRHEVYEACVRAAALPQGFFRLTVPTGGGKTRSGMTFALNHALTHKLDRVIVAIPYTSIIEQTADVYRGIFGNETIVEHHSAVSAHEDASDPVSLNDVWSRLAAENWDASVIVTTTVQLFKSLFERKTTACRKLHNIARSVLILDEVQTLPTHVLEPILDVLRQLVAHYGVTVVLCTATQPALDDSPYLKGLPSVQEIVPSPERLFTELKRVTYEWAKSEEKWPWGRVAEEMLTSPQALAIVNTKSDAIALLEALQDPEALHLSTLLCGAHRRSVLSEVRRRLANGLPCRVVSTQVVEAGVDFDFPLVLRALGPLDRIVQAAGRCNREGKLTVGRVVVFEPSEGKLPPGEYKTAAATSRNLLIRLDFDFDDPEAYQTYFRSLYQVIETDSKNIQALRKTFDYPGVATRFQMINDDTTAVVVRYRGREGTKGEVDRLLSYIQPQVGKLPRWVLRQLQPYIVNVRTRLIDSYQREGFLQQITPGLWEWLGQYDSVRGLTVANRDPEELVV
jgi:CRISPR-associated endonuclease/helicase Cas3